MPAPLSRPPRRVLAVAGAAAIAALALGGCGGDDVGGVVQTDAGIPCAQPRDIPTAEGKPPAPSVPPRPPTGQLVTEDLQPGSGEAAAAGQQVTVQYFVVSCGTGEQIFSTWDAAAAEPPDPSAPTSAPAPEAPGPAMFVLQTPDTITGLVQGISGMQVGGLRKIVVPAELAVGPVGGPLPGGGTAMPNDTLVYAVQLDGVAPAPTTTAPPPTEPVPPEGTAPPASEPAPAESGAPPPSETSPSPP